MHKLCRAIVCLALAVLFFFLPFFLAFPLIYRTCGDPKGNSQRSTGLLCISEGEWIWHASSKERTFDSTDDVSQSWRTCFRANAAKIHAEFLSFEHEHSYKDMLGDYAGNLGATLDKGKSWHQIPLQLWSAENPEVEAFFPILTSCLHQSPLTSLIFSIIDPWSSIIPHTGLTYSILRYHLNLELPQYDTVKDRAVPEYGARHCAKAYEHGVLEPGDTCRQAPVHLGVYDADHKFVKYYEWTKYGDLLFDDMHVHFVQNQTPERRVVVWGDVPRYDVPWYIRLLVQFIHVVIPPIEDKIQDAIHHSEENLRKHAKLKNHFVHRFFGPSFSMIQLIALVISCFVVSLVSSSVKQKLRALSRHRYDEFGGLKDV